MRAFSRVALRPPAAPHRRPQRGACVAGPRSLSDLTPVEWPSRGDGRRKESRMSYYAHPTAVIDTPCEIGEGSRIWHFVHICRNVRLGAGCVLGQNVMIADGVSIGNNVKIQNNVSVYSGTAVEDDVFLG